MEALPTLYIYLYPDTGYLQHLCLHHRLLLKLRIPIAHTGSCAFGMVECLVAGLLLVEVQMRKG